MKSTVLQRFTFVLASVCCGHGLAQAVTFTDIVYPGATTTEALGINNKGDIVGTYGAASGYLLSGGVFTSFTYPGTTFTIATGINDSGEIVGVYQSSNNTQHGFILNGTTFTPVDIPSSSATNVFGINNNGDIVGLYNGGGTHGFRRTAQGALTVLDYPGATFTNAFDINDSGTIVGIYKTSASTTLAHGYIWTNGTFTAIDYPGSSDTTVQGINNSGQISGRYILNGTTYGYVYSNGTFTTLNPSGSVLSDAFKINDAGMIVGYYDKTTTQLQHTGFVTNAINGPQYQITVNSSPNSGGTVSLSPSSTGNLYTSGTYVCATASPAAGQVFTGFSGASLDGANCLTVTSNVTITASFTANPITSSSALRFIPLSPCRVVDTRGAAGPLGAPALAANSSRTFTLPNNCGIPSTALAFSVNLTVVPSTGVLSYVTLWPTGQSQPGVSTLNSYDGRTKSNAAIVPAGTGGGVNVFATNQTDVILDVNGYFDSATDPNGLAFFPLTPCRVADTRNTSGSLGGPSLVGGQMRILPLMSSNCGIPPAAVAYALNLTAAPSGPLGYVTAWPTGQAQPNASTLNAPTGAVTANAAVVQGGNAGAIDVYASQNTDLIVDINGYFAAASGGGYSLYNLAPCRIKDTRQTQGATGFTGTLTISATGGAPCGVPPEARALVLNATVLPSGVLNYLTLWANGSSQPTVSTLNSLDASVTSNLGLIPTSNGLINAFNAGPGSTQLLLDISGYFAP